MADETIKRLFEKIDNLTVAVARLETIVMETTMRRQESADERLNSHSARIRALEQAKTAGMTAKNIFLWCVGTFLTAVSVSMAVVKAIAG